MTEEEKLYGNNYQLRYEELKKKYRSVLVALNETIKEYEEQEKIIVRIIEVTKGRWAICKDVTKCKMCKNGVFDTSYCKDCLIDYFKSGVSE